MNDVWAHMIIFTLVCAFVFAFILLMNDVYSSMQQVRIKQVRTAQAMWHLRDMSLALLMMPESEYARRLAAIGDSDRALLMEVNKNIKNVIFGQQESSRWIQQRLVAGKEHEVWDHGQKVLGFLRESKSGRLQERLDQCMRFRMHVLELAKAMSQAGWTDRAETITSSSGLRRSSIGRHHAAIQDSIHMTTSLEPARGVIGRVTSKILSKPELTQADFKRRISSFQDLNMPEEELDTLFSVLDSNGSGTVTYQKLTDLLAALAPETVLQALHGDGADGHERDSRKSGEEKYEKEEKDEEVPSERGLGGEATTNLIAPAAVNTSNDEPAEAVDI